jgi:hypothetical protein
MHKIRKYGVVISIFIVSVFLLTGCEDSPTEPVSETTAIVYGRVSLPDGTRVPDADILAISQDFGSASTSTDENGEYTLILPVDPAQPATNYTITVTKTGFDPRATTLPLAPGGQVAVNFTFLVEDEEEPRPPSGAAANIVVVNVEATSIGVKGGGFPETTKLLFEARDSDGIPVDSDHRIEVLFSINGGPGGGEFLSKLADSTDDNGQVSVVLNSGTAAGAVQVLAVAAVDDRTLSSTPVRLTIHGGLPAQDHFGIGPARYNFPALQRVNDRLDIVTVVGDKFSNPVRPGTSVYFRTNAGNIQTEAQTDDDGVVSVQLISLGKNIVDPVHGAGFGYVVAETWGENGTMVTDSVLVLLSGRPIITVDPTTFNIPNNQSQTFNYSVFDYNGNPMAEGQSISVSLELPELSGDLSAPELILNGDINRNLPDTQSQAYTEFSFSLSVYGGDEEDVATEMPVTIVISTTGPNGNLELKIQGTVN